MTDVNLNTFPSNRVDALSLLFLENQDLSSLSPEEIAQRYLEANNEIRHAFRNKSNTDKNGVRHIVL
ncbi:hypothetical protein ACO1PF_00595 [Alkalibacterium sp. f15]|uniref:hypothetical protein n=1 Tax=Alkalibacterium sp. f15 TaxID=3414029 RepID=UPI003BF8DD10